MKRVIYFILGAIILFASCKKNNSDTARSGLLSLSFDVNKAVLLKNDSSLLKAKVVDLQYTDSSLIGMMPKLIASGKVLYVFNQHPVTQILKFSATGEFLNIIGCRGSGPNEFIEAYDFFVNYNESQIEILTTNGVYVYDESGKFLKTAKIKEVPAFSFVKDSLDNYWFCTGNHLGYCDFKVHKIAKEKVVERFVKSTDNLLPLQESCFSYNQSGYINFRESLSNKVYRIEGGKFVLQNEIDFGKYKVPVADKSTDPMLYVEELNKKDYCTIDRYFENDDYRYFYIKMYKVNSTEMTGYHWVIDKKNNSEKIIKYENSNADVFLFWPQFLNEKNELVFIGYTQKDIKSGSEYVNKNPTVIHVSVESIFEYAD